MDLLDRSNTLANLTFLSELHLIKRYLSFQRLKSNFLQAHDIAVHLEYTQAIQRGDTARNKKILFNTRNNLEILQNPILKQNGIRRSLKKNW